MPTCDEALNQLSNYIIEARADIIRKQESGEYVDIDEANPLQVYFTSPGIESAIKNAGNMIDLIEDARLVICEKSGMSASEFLTRYRPHR